MEVLSQKRKDFLKRSCGNVSMIPKFAIMNPEFTFSLPSYQTAVELQIY